MATKTIRTCDHCLKEVWNLPCVLGGHNYQNTLYGDYCSSQCLGYAMLSRAADMLASGDEEIGTMVAFIRAKADKWRRIPL
jgi:hypothetical protein